MPLRLLDEIREHLFHRLEIGDHAVSHRPHGFDVRRGSSKHVAGIRPDGFDAATHDVERDNRGLAQRDPAAREDGGVDRPQIEGDVRVGPEEAHAKRQSSSVPSRGATTDDENTPVFSFRARRLPRRIARAATDRAAESPF